MGTGDRAHGPRSLDTGPRPRWDGGSCPSSFQALGLLGVGGGLRQSRVTGGLGAVCPPPQVESNFGNFHQFFMQALVYLRSPNRRLKQMAMKFVGGCRPRPSAPHTVPAQPPHAEPRAAAGKAKHRARGGGEGGRVGWADPLSVPGRPPPGATEAPVPTAPSPCRGLAAGLLCRPLLLPEQGRREDPQET